jgi:uncharacterized membrane protein
VRAVWVASALYALVMTALGIDRYVTYHSGADLGEFVQTIASALHGFGDTAEGGSHFLHHFSPLLYLAAPVLLATHSAIALIALQACAGALTAPAIYLLARKRMDERLATLTALVALVYPALVGVTFTDFHENGFAPAAIAWLIWAVDTRRWAIAAALVAVALAIKEDEAVVLGVLGVGFAVLCARRGDHAGARFGAGVAIASALVFVGYFAVIRPLAGAHGAWFALDYYTGHDFDTPRGAAIVLGRVTFMVEVLLPLLFVPLVTPWFAFALPGLVEVLSSRWSITYTMGQHYGGVWIAYVLAAFAVGIGQVAATRPQLALNLARASLAVCVLNLAVASPTHWGHYLRLRSAHDAALDRLVAQVPPHAAVATYDEVYSHLGFDPNAQIGFDPQAYPEYALFDERYDGAAWRTMYRPRLLELLRAGTYRAIATEDGATLYRASASTDSMKP